MSRKIQPELAPARGASSAGDSFGADLPIDGWFDRLRAATATDAGGLGRLGEYELIGIGGRGGQGVVYRARQPRTGREVALKRLGAGVFATPEMRARFAREIELASALDHAHIVTIFGSEQLDDQIVLTLQWVEGKPFDEWAGAQRRSPREILSVFTVICDNEAHKAVMSAHRTNHYCKFEFLPESPEDKKDPSWFELRLEINELTQTTFIKVFDYSDFDDMDELYDLWEGLIDKLRKVVGG